MPRDFDAVLFDFGGVLSSSPSELMGGLATAYGVPLLQILPTLIGPLDEDTDHPYHRLERGEITTAEYDEAMVPLWRDAGYGAFPGIPGAADAIGALRPIPEMIDTASAARRAGYRTAIVTNNMREFVSWRAVVEADELVDEVVDSSIEGVRKPDRAIFELTLDRLGGVAPQRVVFLDDFAWNVAAAARLGLHAIHVTDPVVAAAELRSLLSLG